MLSIFEILTDASALGFLVISMSVGAISIWWLMQRNRLKRKVIRNVSLHVNASPEEETARLNKLFLLQKKAIGSDVTQLLQYLELDKDIWEHAPALRGVKGLSLGRYLSLLKVPEGFDAEASIISLLAQYGCVDVAPFIMALVPSKFIRSTEEHGQATFTSLAKTVLRSTVVSLSPLTLLAFSRALFQIYGSKKGPSSSLLMLYSSGQLTTPSSSSSSSSTSTAAAAAAASTTTATDPYVSLPSGKLLTDLLLQDLKEAPDAECTLVSPGLFPNLYKGTSPSAAPHRRSPRHTALATRFSFILNRLMANGLPENRKLSDMEHEPFTLRLKPKGKLISSLEELVVGMADNDSAWSIRMGTVSRLTSFGGNVSFKDENGNMLPVPLAVPYRTGLKNPNIGHDDEIVSLLPHAAIVMRIEGKSKETKDMSMWVEWYHGFEGYCGWFATGDGLLSWQQSEEMEVMQNKPWVSKEQLKRAAEFCSIVSLALATNADEKKLHFGGYAYNGVCIDSVALLQMAVEGSTTLFPLSFGGDVKTDMAKQFRALQREIKNQDWIVAIDELVNAVIAIPNDALISPGAVKDAYRRLYLSLPATSPFIAVHQARSQAQQYMKEVEHIMTPVAMKK